MALSPQEQQILQSIVVSSENDPQRPEFPPQEPKFPATPTYMIEVPGFTNVWLKDESENPTGTHKDRMAWEIVVTYRDFLLAKKRGLMKGPLPTMSIISSGSAAVAIQTMLRHYGLPNLKVLMDVHVDAGMIAALEHLGCETFLTDLSKKPLEGKDILALTHNEQGLDITSNEALGPTTRFYDWLSYEVINNSPDFCFVPFGTGNLYENILNITKSEVTADVQDPRFQGDVEKLRACNFMGATTNNPLSRLAEKLYSPHLPFLHFDEQWIRFYRSAGYCGPQSHVYLVREEFVEEAIALAEKLKITCEPSGIAGLALLLQMRDSVPSDAKVLIINTGRTKYGCS